MYSNTIQQVILRMFFEHPELKVEILDSTETSITIKGDIYHIDTNKRTVTHKKMIKEFRENTAMEENIVRLIEQLLFDDDVKPTNIGTCEWHPALDDSKKQD